MLDAPPSATSRPDTGLGLRYRLLLPLARAVVFIEKFWPLAGPVLAVAGLFVGIALLDILPHLPQWLHGIVLVAFAGGLALTLRRAWENLPKVSRAAARHRLIVTDGVFSMDGYLADLATVVEEVRAGRIVSSGTRAVYTT